MAYLHGGTDLKTADFVLQLQREELEAALSEATEHDKVSLQLQLDELNLVETARNDTVAQEATNDRRPSQPAAFKTVSLLSSLFATEPSIYQGSAQKTPQNGAIPNNVPDNEQGDDKQSKLLFTCVACTDTLPWSRILEAPCGHHYCSECLSELFELSMKDETLYPPRCCQRTIPLEDAKLVLDPKLVRNFEHKSIELDTKDRTYCFDPRCSAFIPAEHIADDVTGCPDCGKRTCAVCKAAAHRGDCPHDEALQQLLQAAEAQGWQRCYSCRRLVELRHGCNHMTCLCGAQFCYVCGASWSPRACNHPQWDEARLQERAEQLFARDPHHRLYRPPPGALYLGVDAAAAPAQPPNVPGNGQVLAPFRPMIIAARDLLARLGELRALINRPAALVAAEPARMAYEDFLVREIERRHVQNAPVARAGPHRAAAAAPLPAVPNAAVRSAARGARDAGAQDNVAQIREDVRRNNECNHARWARHQGRHRCEECNNMLTRFILECRQCHIRACQRCRRNRL
ncbi:hypothetical protein KCU65_g9938, partial [Aureobasidium melanogenum]